MADLRQITIEVVEANALTFEADALALKYAQALYGVDAEALARSGARSVPLPLPGGHSVVATPGGVAAHMLLLIGVVSLDEFGYVDIRDFGRRALSTLASEQPGAQTVALTIHGPGYGLDEIEAFDWELAGILDAIHARDLPRALERVVIVEIDPGRAARLKRRLIDSLGGEEVVAGVASHPDVGHATQRDHAFVAMPFSPDFDDLFHYGISSAVRSAGLRCERIDRQSFTGEILERLKRQIETARVVVADLTTSNPNVFLEVGYAWGTGVPTVLLSRKGSELTFDVRGHRCLIYSGIKDAEGLLTKELSAILR